ncbi:uncharacterized protein [Temnothorax longispinosus]|uniref:uncharacterized protein n=1 Tax=Temnothorax longispinosus TaxID=300112 RepID=UPI003A99383E
MSEGKKRRYKSCFFRKCGNTTITTPTKSFLPVPKGKARKQWIKIIRGDGREFSQQSALYCCEDHFNLQEDLENYTRILLDPSANVRLRKGALPKIRKQAVNDAVFKENEAEATVESVNNVIAEEKIEKTEFHNILELESGSPKVEEIQLPIKPVVFKNRKVQTDKINQCHKRIQIDKVNMRDNQIDCRPTMVDAQISTLTWKSISANIVSTSSSTKATCTSLDDTLEMCEEFLPSEETSDEILQKKYSLKEALERHLLLIKEKPKVYIGLPANGFFIINLLCEKTNISVRDICLTLSRIKLSDTYSCLGDCFGLGATSASVIFRQTLPVLALHLKKLIIWPSAISIRRNLPREFHGKYYNVQSIIDCLEIEIQKPTNPIHQSITWSEYKKCNTLKYLISATPDGHINFISEGFGGRITDAAIVEKSQYL